MRLERLIRGGGLHILEGLRSVDTEHHCPSIAEDAALERHSHLC